MSRMDDDLKQVRKWLSNGYKEVKTAEGQVQKVELTQEEKRAYGAIFEDSQREEDDLHNALGMNQEAF